ncbi:MAG: hypothetical protein LBR56_05735 [Sporomusaceae bacterium]|jgi:hypothetical protein|nr:hypothetical protein [Sporomusaceae bacterium]
MNFFSINSVANYAKVKDLEFKWQKRKDNPFLEKGENAVKEDPQIAMFKEQWRQQQKSQATASIIGKLQAGVRLSPDELEYLKANAPMEYEKAVQVEREREQYKRELENCKSKEDVEKLNQRKLSQFFTEASAVANNPNISDDKKRERLEVIGMRLMAVMDEHVSFKETEKYKRLPDKDEEQDTVEISAAEQEAKPPVEEDENPLSTSEDTLSESEDILKKLGELLEDVLLPAGDSTPAKPAPTETDTAPALPRAPQSAHVYNSQGQKSSAGSNTQDISVEV